MYWAANAVIYFMKIIELEPYQKFTNRSNIFYLYTCEHKVIGFFRTLLLGAEKYQSSQLKFDS